MYNSSANRRIQHLFRILNNVTPRVVINNLRSYTSEDTVSIGNVVKEIKPAKRPEYVPRGYGNIVFNIN